MEREELASWLRLTLTPGVGNESARKLMAAFGPPSDIFTTPAAALRRVVSSAQVSALAAPPPELPSQLKATLAWLDQADTDAPRRVLHLADAGYPPALLNMEDPPLLLYLQGHLPAAWPAGYRGGGQGGQAEGCDRVEGGAAGHLRGHAGVSGRKWEWSKFVGSSSGAV